jgi:hypothetical protein
VLRLLLKATVATAVVTITGAIIAVQIMRSGGVSLSREEAALNSMTTLCSLWE